MTAITLAVALCLSTAMPADARPDTAGFEPAGSYPFRLGTTLILDTARDVAFVGSGSGVLVIDISNPQSPQVLSDRIRCQTMVKDLWLDGNRLYVTLFSYYAPPPTPRDLEIWDVSAIENPTMLGSFDFETPAIAVWARDSLMLASSWRALRSFNVADPAHPVCLESLPVLPAEHIRVIDTLAYVAMNAGGVSVYSISDPADLRLLGTWGPSGTWPWFDIVSDRLFLAQAYGTMGYEGGFWVYDISDPAQGVLLAAVDTSYSSAWRVAVHDTIAAVTHSSRVGVRFYSVADPVQPRALADYGGNCWGVALRDTLAYVAFYHNFEILNVADPAHPLKIGSVGISFAGNDVAATGGRVYSAGHGLSVLVAGPAGDLDRLGTLDIGGDFASIVQDDTLALALVASDSGGVFVAVVGLSDDTHPDLLSVLPVTTTTAMLLHDTVAYIYVGDSLRIYSLADPRVPALLGTTVGPADRTRFVLRDTLLYAGGTGVTVFDVADLAHPEPIADTGIQMSDFACADTFLYAVTPIPGALQVFSVASPTSPRLLRTVEERLSYPATVTLNDTLLATSSFYDVTLWSIAQPDNPVHLASRGELDPPGRVAFAGDTLVTSLVTRYAITRLPSGISLEPVGSGHARELLAWPTVAANVLNVRGADITLVDVTGRKVLSLHDGENDIRQLQPGVYFARRSSDKATAKVVVRR